MADDNSKISELRPRRKDYVIEVFFMLGAFLPVLVSAYISSKTGEGHWFQRSGALMVLFSVAVEYHRRRMSERMGATERTSTSALFRDKNKNQAKGNLISRFWSGIPYVCYLSIAVGTLIWSYGDLLFA